MKEANDWGEDAVDELVTQYKAAEVVLPSPKKEPSLKLTPPERKRKLSMRRFKY